MIHESYIHSRFRLDARVTVVNNKVGLTFELLEDISPDRSPYLQEFKVIDSVPVRR